MPKILIAFSDKVKKDRKAATSSVNLKKLIEKRVEKDGEDISYSVITINAKMKLANVVALMNSSVKKLSEHEGKVSIETYKIDPTKERKKWSIEAKKAKE